MKDWVVIGGIKGFFRIYHPKITAKNDASLGVILGDEMM